MFFLGGVIGAYVRHAARPPRRRRAARPLSRQSATPPPPPPGDSSWMNDALGRRAPLLIAGAMVTVAALLGTTTTTYWWLLCVRCMYGVGMGINNASLAIYYAEITPKAERCEHPSSGSPLSAPRRVTRRGAPAAAARSGGVIATTEVFFAVGGIVACVVQLLVQAIFTSPWWQPNGAPPPPPPPPHSNRSPDARARGAPGWRILMGMEAVPGLVMLLGSIKCTESPHWLLWRGQSAEAERVLHRIYQPTRGAGGTCDCVERNADLADALDGLARGLEARFFKGPQKERALWDSLRHGFRKLAGTLLLLRSPVKRIRRALEINVVMSTMPLIGIGCIPQQFVPMLLEVGVVGGRKRGHGGADAISRATLLIDCACNVVYVLGSVCTCVLLVEKIGRRMPLVLCLLGASVGFALDALTYNPGVAEPGSRRHLVIALSGVMIGYVCRAMGVGPLHQVIGAEIVPLEIAARGKALYAMNRRGTAMLFNLFFPPLFASCGGENTFTFLAFATAAYCVVVFLRLPETKGYEVSEIETLLEVVEWVPWTRQPPPAAATRAAERGGGGGDVVDAGSLPLRLRPPRITGAKGRLTSCRSGLLPVSPDMGA